MEHDRQNDIVMKAFVAVVALAAFLAAVVYGMATSARAQEAGWVVESGTNPAATRPA